MSPHLLLFNANLSFQKTNGAKFGQYRGCRTAMLFYTVLMMVYDIRTRTLFGLNPLYKLKHNAFQGQNWPHLKACFLQNNCHQIMIIYTVTNPD